MFQALTSQPFGVLWRAALARAPRLTPTQILKWTDPEGPYPITLELSSRGKHKIPLFIFIKEKLTERQVEKLPVVVDFHGGGFVLGSCLEQAPFASKLARELDAVVISVDYRMGPVDKFPAAIEDAEDVLKAVFDSESTAGIELRTAIRTKILANTSSRKAQKAARRAARAAAKASSSTSSLEIPSKPPSIASSIITTPTAIDLDTTRVAISGFSSGGNIALNLALHLQDPHWPSVIPPDQPPLPLLLFFPSLDARLLPSERPLHPDAKELSNSSSVWHSFGDILGPTYLPRDQAGHLRASPGLAPVDAIHGAARMLLVLPGRDSLAIQSGEWVQKIEDHGERVEHLRVKKYREMKHGWTQFPDSWLDEGEKAAKEEIFAETVEFIREIWEEA